MADLTNINAADQVLQSEVSTLLTDFATALGNANDQAGVDQVAQDMRDMAAKIEAADPNAASPAGS